MGKYFGHRLVARPEPDNTFWTSSTFLEVRALQMPTSTHRSASGKQEWVVVTWNEVEMNPQWCRQIATDDYPYKAIVQSAEASRHSSIVIVPIIY